MLHKDVFPATVDYSYQMSLQPSRRCSLPARHLDVTVTQGCGRAQRCPRCMHRHNTLYVQARTDSCILRSYPQQKQYIQQQLSCHDDQEAGQM